MKTYTSKLLRLYDVFLHCFGVCLNFSFIFLKYSTEKTLKPQRNVRLLYLPLVWKDLGKMIYHLLSERYSYTQWGNVQGYILIPQNCVEYVEETKIYREFRLSEMSHKNFVLHTQKEKTPFFHGSLHQETWSHVVFPGLSGHLAELDNWSGEEKRRIR